MMVADFNLELWDGKMFNLYGSLSSGPVVLNFIKGTWCPFCRNHMQNLVEWTNELKKNGKMVHLVCLSTESNDLIKAWVKQNPINFAFGSDKNGVLAERFRVLFPIFTISRPAMIVVDQNKSIRLSQKAVYMTPSKRLISASNQIVCDICT